MIKIEHIQKNYRKKKVLENISFSANCGECVAIVGRNGCGKTTLMQILAGVVRPDAGELIYFDRHPLKQPKLFRQYCGYIPQEMPLIEELTVKDNLRLWGAGCSKMYAQIIHYFSLENIMHMKVSKLSGGMKRRLSIACALAKWPPVLLMDEPTTALDLYYKESIWDWIKQYKAMNGIVVITTHDEKEIIESDRCLVMYEGTLREVPEEKRDISVIMAMMEVINS